MPTSAATDLPAEPMAGSAGEPLACFNEAWSAPGIVRPHWERLLALRSDGTSPDFSNPAETARRILRDHGVTYNATDGLEAVERPWELDAIPFVIDAREWASIEAGAVQRARLLNQILNDIYVGPQRLLRDGFIPPGLVYPNPNFLRACRGIRVPGDVYLHLLAMDLGRAPDGRWMVLSDRTQAPSGIGYALENRTIVGRVLPREFADCKVRRLQYFFNSLRQNLRDLAPSPTGWPRIVFMSSGSSNEAYYEHSLLARFLGVTLVEGSDLTVRDRRVFLKTLEGLQRVDVIVRRVSDTCCDPLELADASHLGVPGLVEAVRAGHVLVANGLGSALVESPAFIPFLPALCRHVLAEDILLPSAATWWCGEAAEQNHVLASLDSLVVKGAFEEQRRQTVSGAEVAPDAREKLRREILAQPHKFVGQEHLNLSQAPVWNDDRLESRPLVLRIYVAACGDSYQALPGGLSKVSQSSANPLHGFQVGGGSKDTWVLGADESPPVVGGALELETRPAERLSAGVPSRVADNLYWLGRYSERLEHRVHLLQAVVGRLADNATDASGELSAICPLIAEQHEAPPDAGPLTPANIGQAALDLVYATNQPNGIVALLEHLGRIVASVRDRLSATTWRVFNRLDRYPGSPSRGIPFTRAGTKLHDLIVDLAALSGMEMENMTRGVDWRFLDLGRRIERAGGLAGLLHTVLTALADPTDALNPVLEIADSTMTYRRRYFSEPDIASVLELLLLDETNPRSFAFQLNEIGEHIRAFPATQDGGRDLPEERELAVLKELADAAEFRRLLGAHESGLSAGVEEYFNRAGDSLANLSDALTHRYINLTPPEESVG